MKYALLLIAALAIATSTPAVAADEANGVRIIFAASNNIRRNGTPTRWRYGVDAPLGHYERGSGTDFYGLRPSLGYDLKSNMTVWAGFGYFVSEPKGGSRRHERRWWQQFNWTAKHWDWGTLVLRTRLEERDFENTRDVGVRFRQQLLLAMPLPSKTATLIASVEHHSNLRDTDWGASSGFEQFRSYLGLRLPVHNKLMIEVGYMNQLIDRHSEDAMNHIAMLQFRAKL
ncbi:MAG: DUF2490 domain-containing protein [Woeseia sp.]